MYLVIDGVARVEQYERHVRAQALLDEALRSQDEAGRLVAAPPAL